MVFLNHASAYVFHLSFFKACPPNIPVLISVQVMEPRSDRFYLFNFFERTDNVEGLLQKWEAPALYAKDIDHFISTFLHESKDPNAV